MLTERQVDGRTVRGFSVTFDKRYITLAPVATVVGLAFQAMDPGLPEGAQQLGITCALIPVPTHGMDIGRRHSPMNSAFMNGPIRGTEVFVPLDWVVGGEAGVGQGWRMLMETLAAGRAISLPALGSAMQQTALFVMNGYGQIREQFGLPIGKFHAISSLIARTAADLYATDAARRYTAVALDAGERPSVAGAILKVHLTEAGRRAVIHGMDVLGGKAIMRGPGNLLGVTYRHAPIAITVEGANILTRSLIIFGQGAVRCHPHVLDEMAAVAANDPEALAVALRAHAGHVLRNLWASLAGAPVRGTAPTGLEGDVRLIARLSAKYALTADLAMGLLGGKLKRMELLSARLGDALSFLYMASASVWRYRVDAEPRMLPLARAAIRIQLDQAAGSAARPVCELAVPGAARHGAGDPARNPPSRPAARQGPDRPGRSAARRRARHGAAVPRCRAAPQRRPARPHGGAAPVPGGGRGPAGAESGPQAHAFPRGGRRAGRPRRCRAGLPAGRGSRHTGRRLPGPRLGIDRLQRRQCGVGLPTSSTTSRGSVALSSMRLST